MTDTIQLPQVIEDVLLELEMLLDEEASLRLVKLRAFMLMREENLRQALEDKNRLSEQLRVSAESVFRLHEERERDRRALREEHRV